MFFICTAICGPTELIVTNKTQVLTSPNYPSPYGNNLKCIWSLHMDPTSSVLSLRFTDLDLGAAGDCLNDYLEVQYTEVNIKYFKLNNEFDTIVYPTS